MHTLVIVEEPYARRLFCGGRICPPYSMPWWVDTTVSTQPLHDLSHRRETRESSVGSGPLAVEMPMITEPKPRNVEGETS